jgi:hypothetical protein
VVNTQDFLGLRTLEDASHTIAEAFRLAASRHRQLDLDPSEFGSGFRIVPSDDRNRKYFDIYLFDTLSGGAGYAELVGSYLGEILDDTLELLKNCPDHCDTSCYGCLRHFYNQHLASRLDRQLGAELLDYALNGVFPVWYNKNEQSKLIRQLQRLLEMDGCECKCDATIEGLDIPLIVKKGGKEIGVGLHSGLLDQNQIEHPLHDLDHVLSVKILNGYLLKRNLPDAHQKISQIIK